MFSSRSKEDFVTRISKSVFITNFPDNFGPRDLWKLCEAYGKVVDVFILNRKSKAGKHFAFVRFIRVSNVDRLIGNLCTLWIGRFHLHANAVRYERPIKPHNHMKNSLPSDEFKAGTYANVVKDIHAPPRHVTHSFNNPAVVLNDSCFVERDLSCHVMGNVKELSSIQNLSSVLAKEGFLEAATNDFISEERVVWVDIEGILMHVWSQDTFLKIEYVSDDEAPKGGNNSLVDPQLSDEEVAGDSDDEGVFDTFLVIIIQRPLNENNADAEPSLTHPPGFTPDVSIQEKNHDSIPQNENVTVLESHVNESSYGISSFNVPRNTGKGGSILDVLDDMIRVGQSMGYKMEGCSKDIERIIGLQVRSEEERFGSLFNRASTRNFNNFIALAGLVEIKMEGYLYTWSHPSATKMSKLDRFMVTEVAIDKSLDCGVVYDEILLTRMELSRKLYDIKQSESADFVQKSKVKWAIKGDENSKFFHGLINKKRS
uniref:RNA-directed DNA polymerase, eukaryota, nucleotide-binding alpha-beta plait domain protein n=1 Tax=Tanacetum cinerariifolium TaxID=118510 RepID=A0A699J3Y5_TANCI|nr:RNA-directed DNA polymerase, eukaryota, nucleotide-binding alpha-beta plait domain protein [Tanacetum cinerariifolium]